MLETGYYLFKQSAKGLGMVTHTWEARQEDCHKFTASVDSRVNSRPA